MFANQSREEFFGGVGWFLVPIREEDSDGPDGNQDHDRREDQKEYRGPGGFYLVVPLDSEEICE